MRTLTPLVLGTLLALHAAGCASARCVYKTGECGVVAIPRNTPLHRQRAEALMAEHFPEGYEIVEEQEVPVGTLVQSDEELRMVSGVMLTPNDPGGLALHFDTSSIAEGEVEVTTVPPTSIPREWRIVYRSAEGSGDGPPLVQQAAHETPADDERE